jgi:predicted AAA+ superfamily ATPase
MTDKRFLYRKMLNQLTEWKNSAFRQPLILQGARQVGKTFALLEFGKDHYENVAYLNFETEPLLIKTFSENIEPGNLIPQLSRISHEKIMKDKTLIILDEVQLCERALTSLKYFCEQAPDYHIAAAGSLLGVAVNRKQFSFPVGKVDMKTLYPMDMEEFFLACEEDELLDKIKNCFQDNTPLPAALHEAALALYRQYLVVGGMPDCVHKFLQTGDLILARHVQNMILASYMNDMSKYNTQNEIKKVHQVYDNVTVQLSQKNTRFRYKLIKPGARASEFENAIEWLCLCGIVMRIYNVDQPKKPLENFKDIDTFKIYVSDSGLLCAKKNIVPRDVLYPGADLSDFRGGMTENYVCGQLTAKEHTGYYWTSGRSAEVDFVIQREGNVIPIEVKSAENTKAKSLDVYIKQYKPEYAVKLCAKNFGFENKKKTVPLYAAFCL